MKHHVITGTVETGGAAEATGEAQRRMNVARASYARSLEVRDRIAGAGATTTAAGLAMGTPVMAAVKAIPAWKMP
ncbi:hypothetical protein MYA98_21890 [Salmonella sp. WGH-01]|nr:hypothetical protein MYA98_21890 [Salmonella sp. WGH-01]